MSKQSLTGWAVVALIVVIVTICWWEYRAGPKWEAYRKTKALEEYKRADLYEDKSIQDYFEESATEDNPWSVFR